METKPTPGPWRHGFMDPRIVVAENHPAGKMDVVRCLLFPRESSDQYDDEDLANASLIIAACNGAMTVNPENPIAADEALPALFDAVRDTQEWLEEMLDHPPGGIMELLEAAIAAATKEATKGDMQ